jgi:hypothetical protein
MAADRIRDLLLEGLGANPSLPAGFIFSQGSLQDFNDCRRRFLLRYLLRLSWPALESEPVLESERRMQLGERFHRLAQQYWLGVPAARLDAMIQDEELHGWWLQFARFAQELRGARRLYPEVGLSAPLGDHRLVAQYDLIVAEADGRFTIYDWKTSRRKPRRAGLAERLQSRVYPYLLARAGAGFNGGQPLPPPNVAMIYWFPAQPDQPERFTYSAGQYAEDQAHLAGLVQEIVRLTQDLAERGSQVFPLTERAERCAYCVYRSLCERGERAGALDEAEPLDEAERALEIALDFEQIAEIEF